MTRRCDECALYNSTACPFPNLRAMHEGGWSWNHGESIAWDCGSFRTPAEQERRDKERKEAIGGTHEINQ